MGRIVASVQIDNASDVTKGLRCDALVDTGASLMVLPSVWRDRLGELKPGTEIEVETATQEIVRAEVCGPVRIQIEGFRPIFSEVCFAERNGGDGDCESLIGHLVLAQSQVGVDVLRHRLFLIKHMDLKRVQSDS